MKYDLLLKGGHLVDPKNGVDKLLDIGIKGGKVEDVKQYSLPDGSRRAIIVIKKISQTSTKYPRPSAKMKKQPLK